MVQGQESKDREDSTGEAGEREQLKILVCGGRDFRDKEFVFYALDRINPDIVVHGGARGADSLAGEWCQARGKEERVYPARWNIHGKVAGPLRNREMLKEELDGLDGVIAFPGGNGTRDMVSIAKKALPPKSVFVLQRR